jgi:hypothetical protein
MLTPTLFPELNKSQTALAGRKRKFGETWGFANPPSAFRDLLKLKHFV